MVIWSNIPFFMELESDLNQYIIQLTLFGNTCLALSEQVLVLVVSNTEACSAGLKVNMIVMEAQ